MNDLTPTSHARESVVFSQKGQRSTKVGIAFNLALAVGKTIAGVLGHSFALVADGLESFSDILSSLVVLYGLKIAVKPRDENHPYGHGKAEPLAALAVGIALVVAAIGIAVQSVREIITPHASPAPFTLIVLAGVLVIKEGLFRYVNRVGTAIASQAVRADAWHHRSDAITSALAFIGISVALIGGRGWETADDWAALAASVIIFYNAVLQMLPAVAELSDEAPPKTIEQEVRSIASSIQGVRGLDKCFVRKMGFDFYVDLHILVDGNIPVKEGHWIAHQVEDAILASAPSITDVLIHVEPTPQTRR
jgi:cation diffusion facilitator family transporter